MEHFWWLHDRGVIDADAGASWSRNVAILLQPEVTRTLWHKLESAGIFHPKCKRFVDGLSPTGAPAPQTAAASGA